MLKFMAWGCLTLMLLLGGGGFMAWRWWQTDGKKAVATQARRAVDVVLEDSALSADDKKKLRVRLDRIQSDYQQGRLTMDDVGRLAKDLAESPLLPAAAAYSAVDAQLKDPQGPLSDEKKRAHARRTLERFTRGMLEKKIDHPSLDAILEPLQEKDGEGKTHLKDKPSTRDVETALAHMKDAADAAKVPDEPYPVDFVGEFTRLMDRALDKSAPTGN